MPVGAIPCDCPLYGGFKGQTQGSAPTVVYFQEKGTVLSFLWLNKRVVVRFRFSALLLFQIHKIHINKGLKNVKPDSHSD